MHMPCLGYRKAVCPSHSAALAKRCNLGSRNLHCRLPDTCFRICKACPEIRMGSPRSRALNEKGVWKICDFQPITLISETVRDRAKVTANQLIDGPIFHSHCWRNAGSRMTLNGRTAVYCTNDASFGAHHENLKEGRYYQPQKCDLGTLLRAM